MNVIRYLEISEILELKLDDFTLMGQSLISLVSEQSLSFHILWNSTFLFSSKKRFMDARRVQITWN